MHPVFGQFKENIEDAAPATGRDFRFAQHFCTEAVHFYPLESRWVGQQLLTPDRPDILVRHMLTGAGDAVCIGAGSAEVDHQDRLRLQGISSKVRRESA
jgi:hypothetical protein